MHIETVVVKDKLTGKELFEKNGKTILANEDESNNHCFWIIHSS